MKRRNFLQALLGAATALLAGPLPSLREPLQTIPAFEPKYYWISLHITAEDIIRPAMPIGQRIIGYVIDHETRPT